MLYEELMIRLITIWRQYEKEYDLNSFLALYNIFALMVESKKTHIHPRILTKREGINTEKAYNLLLLCWKNGLIDLFTEGVCPYERGSLAVMEPEKVNTVEELLEKKKVESCFSCGDEHSLEIEDLYLYFYFEGLPECDKKKILPQRNR